MFCEKCGKNHATTHIKTVVNGIAREYNLCDSCALDYGYSGNSLTGMLASMFGDINKISERTETKKCPVCNSTLSDILKSGKAGCADCYITFYDQLLVYLKRVHGSIKHIGKTPFDTNITVDKKIETIKDLKAQLEQSITQENYEQAAILRDKIKEMENGGNE